MNNVKLRQPVAAKGQIPWKGPEADWPFIWLFIGSHPFRGCFRPGAGNFLRLFRTGPAWPDPPTSL